MARSRFNAEVLTPDGEVFNEEIEMLSTRTTTGSIGLLANHEPVLARLEPTELRLYRSETEIVRYAQAEGYLQMAENRVLVLVEEAIAPERLDVAELRERVAAARAAAEQATPDTEQAARAARDLRRAEAFLAIAGGADK
jgi:F-type H+-transporting ATPase subunit epsilon